MTSTRRRPWRRSFSLFALVLTGSAATAPAQVDVPLTEYRSPNWPGGFTLGWALGLSFGDYDGDGWVDLYDNLSGYLWHNEAGRDWVVHRVLQNGPVELRYGVAFGDYNRDGLPDMASEPRPGTCFKLFRNEGNGNFTNLGRNTEVIIGPCSASAETACWGDVDFDGWIDLFLPTYPTVQGNYFWRNEGPVGVRGQHRFTEMAAAVGLLVPVGNSRPEGAQFCDYDRDGDLDAYSNGAIYLNQSTLGQPAFAALTEASTGVGMSALLDEGALWADYDLDGDFDLLVSYTRGGNVIWEHRGDGTYFQAEPGIVESPGLGLDFGTSAVDWDNDGDIDWTTRHVFRRNLLVETGQRRMMVATHAVSPLHVVRPTISWADSDRDGDLDAAVGNFWPEQDGDGHFYENTTYDAATLPTARRHLRVRPLRDEVGRPGTETEFGALAEVSIAGDRMRRVGFTATGHGYINQNEYPLHFALPAPAAGPTVFGLKVDFVHDPAVGQWRVDRHVNPVLTDLILESIGDREIDVYRSGRVVVDGCDVAPQPSESPLLQTSAGGLVAPTAGAGVPAVTTVLFPDNFVGIEVTTQAAPLRVLEIVLDGQLATTGPFNLAFWDVTNFEQPLLVDSRATQTSSRNDRSYLPVDVLLRPGRTYRVVAHIDAFRATPVAAPVAGADLVVEGGLRYEDIEPTAGAFVRIARLDPTQVYLALRYRPALLGTPIDLGNGLAPSAGVSAALAAAGPVTLGRRFDLDMTGLPPAAQVFLIAGTSVRYLRAQGQTFLVPGAAVAVPAALTATAAGTLTVPLVLPRGLPAGLVLAFQVWYADPGAGGAFASSNVLAINSPF